MREKITLEKFRELKEKTVSIYNFFDSGGDYIPPIVEKLFNERNIVIYEEDEFENSDIKNNYENYEQYGEEFLSKITNLPLEIQNELLSYDLSDIPYEEWDNMVLYSNGLLDLSETKGNFDFSRIKVLQSDARVEDKPELRIKNCNVINLGDLNFDKDHDFYQNVIIKKENFDEKTIASNKTVFLEDLTDNIKNILDSRNYYYTFSRFIDDLALFTKEDFVIIQSSPFFDYIFSADDSFLNRNLFNLFFKNSKNKNLFFEMAIKDINELLYLIKQLDDYRKYPILASILEQPDVSLTAIENQLREFAEDSMKYLNDKMFDGSSFESFHQDEYKKEFLFLNKTHIFQEMNFHINFESFPIELQEKINSNSLTLDDFIKYPDYLNNHLLFLFTNDDKVISIAKEKKRLDVFYIFKHYEEIKEKYIILNNMGYRYIIETDNFPIEVILSDYHNVYKMSFPILKKMQMIFENEEDEKLKIQIWQSLNGLPSICQEPYIDDKVIALINNYLDMYSKNPYDRSIIELIKFISNNQTCFINNNLPLDLILKEYNELKLINSKLFEVAISCMANSNNENLFEILISKFREIDRIDFQIINNEIYSFLSEHKDNISDEYIDKLDNLINFLKIVKEKANGDGIIHKAFESFFSKRIENLMEDDNYLNEMLGKIDNILILIRKMHFSNSSELRHISSTLIAELSKLPDDEIIKKYDLIEDVFVKNNIPYFTKLFKVFETLYPNIPSGGSKTLSSKSKEYRKIIIFSDILKASIRSNDKNLVDYINSIKTGTVVLKMLVSGEINIDDLDKEELKKEKESFITFIAHLNTLYNNTSAGKKEPNYLTNNLIKDAYNLLSKFLKCEKDQFDIDKLPDRITRMFCHFAGIDTLEQLETMIVDCRREAHERNVARVKERKIILEKGDFVKGLINYDYVENTLRHGALCKEFLGSFSDRDATPMDTDVGVVENDTSFSSALRSTVAVGYGGPYVVFKHDDRFYDTSEEYSLSPNRNKYEVMKNGSNAHGIRCGIGSEEIDFIIVDKLEYLEKLKLEIVMGGFYIPVTDLEGNIIFTPEQYEELISKANGLSFYGREDEFEFAEELDSFDVSDYPYEISVSDNYSEVSKKRNLIIQELAKTGLKISTKRQQDMSNGIFEFLDTGSTGRGTNSANDYDFDFILKVDNEVLKDETKKQELLEKIKSAIPGVRIDGLNIRKGKMVIDGQEILIDISIMQKDDKMVYSTDECIKDRLDSIKRIDPDKHKKVIENIVLAKEVLKEAKAYKPKHAGDGKAEGGLGGVGVENWILQHGGSFERAARSFLAAAEGREFSEFCKVYKVFDFGENHMFHRRHDEFVSNNMNEVGYEKTVEALKRYIELVDSKEKGNKQL